MKAWGNKSESRTSWAPVSILASYDKSKCKTSITGRKIGKNTNVTDYSEVKFLSHPAGKEP